MRICRLIAVIGFTFPLLLTAAAARAEVSSAQVQELALAFQNSAESGGIDGALAMDFNAGSDISSLMNASLDVAPLGSEMNDSSPVIATMAGAQSSLAPSVSVGPVELILPDPIEFVDDVLISDPPCACGAPMTEDISVE